MSPSTFADLQRTRRMLSAEARMHATVAKTMAEGGYREESVNAARERATHAQLALEAMDKVLEHANIITRR